MEEFALAVRREGGGQPSATGQIIMLVGCYVLACMLLRTWGVDIEQPKA